MKFLAKVKTIFNLNKIGNCFRNRSDKSDPRKTTSHSESETRLAMPITCIDLPTKSVNLSANPIREKLERDFELGINMNECIKLLSLSDTELIDQQEIELRQMLIKIEQLDFKDELTSLKDQILDLQNDLTSLRM